MDNSAPPIHRCPHITSRYAVGKLLGKGTYGRVYRARDKRNNADVALKHFAGKHDEDGAHPTILREIGILRSIPPHAHVIAVLDVYHTRDAITMSMPLYSRDLASHMDSFPRRIGATQSRMWGFQMFRGLHHLHSNGVFHRDLKPANILLDLHRHTLVICDLGLAAVSRTKVNHSLDVQTLWYRSPEVLLGIDEYTDAADIWSAGAILAEMLSGVPVWSGDNERDQLGLIFALLGTPSAQDVVFEDSPYFEHVATQLASWEPRLAAVSQPFANVRNMTAADLLQQCFSYNGARRVSATNAIKHAYFSDECVKRSL